MKLFCPHTRYIYCVCGVRLTFGDRIEPFVDVDDLAAPKKHTFEVRLAYIHNRGPNISKFRKFQVHADEKMTKYLQSKTVSLKIPHSSRIPVRVRSYEVNQW